MLSKQKSDGRLSAVSTSGGSLSWLRSTSCWSTDSLHKSQSGWFSTLPSFLPLHSAHVTSVRLRFVKCLRDAPFWNVFGALFSPCLYRGVRVCQDGLEHFFHVSLFDSGENAQIATFLTNNRDWRTHLFWKNVNFCVIFYSNANSLHFFCENSSQTLANFTDWGGDNGA